MLWPALLLACGTPPSSAPVAPAPEPGPQVQTMLGKATGVHFLGDWTSASCGGRGYPRNIRFEDDNGYAGIDLVSPCPAGATCAWSGMVGFAGIWVQQDRRLELREIGGPTEPGSPHPTRFEADEAGNLHENGCVYTRGLTVPEGYAEEQVRPRVPGT